MLKIGNIELENRLVLAPMAGVTNLPFRLIIRRLGAGLVYSEMVSAMGLYMNQKKTMEYLVSDPAERPLAVQIFGSDPSVMAMAADTVIQNGADIVDINMGCPVKKVTKTGSGAALLKSLDRAEKIITTVRAACAASLTVKIRSGWTADSIIACDAARMIEECGANAVIIHARTASQGYSGHADWDIITRVKESVKIPVIGNGDINEPEDVFKMMEQTGCDGVMIGRAASRNPWIFRQAIELEKGNPIYEPGIPERRALIMDQYKCLIACIGDRKAMLCMRGLMLKYTKGLPGSSKFREAFTQIKDFDSLISVMDRYFSTLEERMA
jgi:nifR3 family TIM-barrel protein